MYEERAKFYNLKVYQSDLFDYLFSQCDEISLIGFPWPKQSDAQKAVDAILSFYTNEPLKPHLNRFEMEQGLCKNDICIKLYFSADAEVLAWLKQHKTIFSFDAYDIKKERGVCITKRDEKFLLQDLCFYANNRLLFSTVTHEAQVVVAKDFEPRLYAWYANFIAEKFKPIYSFIEEWNALKGANCNESKLVEHFSSDKYGYALFFKMFDSSLVTVNHWENFYFDLDNRRTFAKVLVQKLKNDGANEQVARMFQWYESNVDDNRPRAGEYEVTAFLVQLLPEKFLRVFKAVLQDLKSGNGLQKKDVYYLDKLFFLWDAYGLPEEKLRFRVFHVIRKAWTDAKESAFKQRRLRALLCRFIKSKSSTKVKNRYARRERASEVDAIVFIDLAYAHYYGIIYQQSYEKAVKYFKKALAVCDQPDCQYDLARCYEQGLGVEKDLAQAEYWYKKAEESGHPKARERLERLT